MVYSLAIGEYKEYEHSSTMITVDTVKHDVAPAFGEPTDYSNERWTSYPGWDDFAAYIGLHDILFENHTIRGGHPGFFDIDTKFKRRVDEAYANHMKHMKQFTEQPRDYQLPRLLWLKYWTDWALENCNRPIFTNS